LPATGRSSSSSLLHARCPAMLLPLSAWAALPSETSGTACKSQEPTTVAWLTFSSLQADPNGLRDLRFDHSRSQAIKHRHLNGIAGSSAG
jgi:hypothetical protein